MIVQNVLGFVAQAGPTMDTIELPFSLETTVAAVVAIGAVVLLVGSGFGIAFRLAAMVLFRLMFLGETGRETYVREHLRRVKGRQGYYDHNDEQDAENYYKSGGEPWWR